MVVREGWSWYKSSYGQERKNVLEFQIEGYRCSNQEAARDEVKMWSRDLLTSSSTSSPSVLYRDLMLHCLRLVPSWY